MIIGLMGWLAGGVARKLILGGVVILLLGAAGLYWKNFKDDLRDEGRQVCIQKINEQTVIDLQDALAAERVTAAELHALAIATAEENAEARARLRDSESKVDSLLAAREEQERTDETYAAWNNTALPDGVADRLRSLRAGSNTNPDNEDSN